MNHYQERSEMMIMVSGSVFDSMRSHISALFHFIASNRVLCTVTEGL